MGERQSALEEMVCPMRALSSTFWQDRPVFVTGHTGFKGSWLSLWLQLMGARVTGFAVQPPTTPSLFHEAKVSSGMTSIEGDVRDLAALTQAIKQARPEIVFHLAAQPLVRHSYVYPVETYATNVMGTVNLLEAVRQADSVKAVVCVTSDKCYENNACKTPFNEEDAMGGHDPYSSSKGCAELVAAAYRRSFFEGAVGRQEVTVATVRAGNVIGGGDWAADRLIPDVLTAFAKGQTALIRNPNSVRPWQHVLEPLRGYMQLAQALVTGGARYSGAFNFGPRAHDEQPVAWLVSKISQLWGEGASWQIAEGQHPHEAGILRLDSSKATKFLDWNPRLNLEEVLQLTVDWYRAQTQGEDMRGKTLAQIEQYELLCASLPATEELVC